MDSPTLLKRLRSLKSPAGIQAFLNRIPYHLADTAWSPAQVYRQKSAHCLEGSIFAATALRAIGHRPWILDLEADKDSDHVIAVYREAGGWGAIAASNYAGCRFRSPIYRTLRELALSYFEDYFNLRGERTLRRFSKPVDLSRFDRYRCADGKDWMTTEKPVWFIAEHLLEIPHTELLTPAMARALIRVDRRTYEAGLYGRVRRPKTAPSRC
jgi:hypothetical protein